MKDNRHEKEYKHNLQYNKDDLVIVYKGHQSFIDGDVCKILDKDPINGHYLVTTLESIGKAKRANPHHYEMELYRNDSHWINNKDCKKINLVKPTLFEQYETYIIGFLATFGFSVGVILGYLGR